MFPFPAFRLSLALPLRVLVCGMLLPGPGAALCAPDDLSPELRQKIEAALPPAALVKPARPRKLLLFDLNVVYGGHGSRFTANHAFALMGERTGAFEAVLSRDPQVFQRESLSRFDAVFLNNTVGNLFEDPILRRNLADFVYGGGGLLGVHGTSVGFTRWPGAHEDWPEFARMLGARGAAHLTADERVWIRNEEPGHPLSRGFDPGGFEFADEFFRFTTAYSRNRCRVLLSIDNARSAQLQGVERIRSFRPDEDYGLAWVRNYGRGRIFYTAFGHNPHVFWDPGMLRLYLAAVQFAVGDLPAPTLPSGRLTDAGRAQEKLGWRLGVEAYTFHKFSFFEAIEKTAALGLPYMGGLSFQKVSADIPKNLDPQLTEEEIAQVRQKLDDAGIRLLTYYIQSIPGDEEGCRKVFEFGRNLGIEVFLSEPAPESLDTIERFCERYGIRLGLHNHDAKASPAYWSPEGILKVCAGRSPLIGACADVGYWMRGGIDPVAAIGQLQQRLITLQMHDLHELSAQGHDVPWGSGAGRSREIFQQMHRLGLRPVMVGLEYSYDWLESLPKMEECIRFFQEVSLDLAKTPAP